jgi:hypothetical protein
MTFILRESRHRLAVRAPAIVRVKLDPVGAVLDLLAHDTRHIIGAARLLCALRNVVGVFGRETFRRILSDPHDGLRHHLHARAWYDSLIDRLLEPYVRVAGAFGAKVAHCGETRHQRGACMIHRARHAQRFGLVQHLVVPRGLVVRMQQ